MESGKMLCCPFCGKPGKLFDYDQGDYPAKEDWFMPGCETGEHIMDFIGTQKECIKYWNRRTV